MTQPFLLVSPVAFQATHFVSGYFLLSPTLLAYLAEQLKMRAIIGVEQ